MCDYSLEVYRSEKAAEGDKLNLERFPSGSKGFTTDSCETAACVAPGTTMLMTGFSDGFKAQHGVGDAEEVMMTRLVDSGPYKDGVRFVSTGKDVLLQLIDGKISVAVIAIPATEVSTEATPEPSYAHEFDYIG